MANSISDRLVDMISKPANIALLAAAASLGSGAALYKTTGDELNERYGHLFNGSFVENLKDYDTLRGEGKAMADKFILGYGLMLLSIPLAGAGVSGSRRRD